MPSAWHASAPRRTHLTTGRSTGRGKTTNDIRPLRRPTKSPQRPFPSRGPTARVNRPYDRTARGAPDGARITVRLGLLASLQHQLRTDLLDAACHAHKLGYTLDELLTLLTIKPPSS
jgi:hypothetical protein